MAEKYLGTPLHRKHTLLNQNFNSSGVGGRCQVFTGPVRYIVQDLSLIWIGLCYSVTVLLCGCMIIGRTQKMLSCDWSRGIQYNLHEPQSREVSVHKESIMIV